MQETWQDRRETNTLLHSSVLAEQIDTHRVEEGKPSTLPYKLRWRSLHNATCWFVLKPVQDKGLVFWQTISNACILHETMLADCVVKKVVTRNLYDTEAETLC